MKLSTILISFVGNNIILKSCFSERLKELRAEKGLSQVLLAKAVGNRPSHTAIALWELKKRTPNLDDVIRLAKFFGVTVGYLAGVED